MAKTKLNDAGTRVSVLWEGNTEEVIIDDPTIVNYLWYLLATGKEEFDRTHALPR